MVNTFPFQYHENCKENSEENVQTDVKVGRLITVVSELVPRDHPLNPLTPRGDNQVTSPYNIHALSNKQVMRILKCIRQKLLS